MTIQEFDSKEPGSWPVIDGWAWWWTDWKGVHAQWVATKKIPTVSLIEYITCESGQDPEEQRQLALNRLIERVWSHGNL